MIASLTGGTGHGGETPRWPDSPVLAGERDDRLQDRPPPGDLDRRRPDLPPVDVAPQVQLTARAFAGVPADRPGCRLQRVVDGRPGGHRAAVTHLLAVDVEAHGATVEGTGDVMPLTVPDRSGRGRRDDVPAVAGDVELQPFFDGGDEAVGADVAAIAPHRERVLEDARHLAAERAGVEANPCANGQALRFQARRRRDGDVVVAEEAPRRVAKDPVDPLWIVVVRGSGGAEVSVVAAPRPVPDRLTGPSFMGHQPTSGNDCALAAA